MNKRHMRMNLRKKETRRSIWTMAAITFLALIVLGVKIIINLHDQAMPLYSAPAEIVINQDYTH